MLTNDSYQTSATLPDDMSPPDFRLCRCDHLGVFRVRGADAASFLHGQLTNDIEHLDENALALAAYCNPKGRVIAVFHVVRNAPDDFLVVTSADLLEPITKLQEEFNMSVILITHDLGVVAETCQRALVMYCGEVIERADIHSLFENPRHPYSRGLLDSIPKLREEKLAELKPVFTLVGGKVAYESPEL